MSSSSLAGSFVYPARTRYIGRIICNQLMSKDEVEFRLLNETEPTYFEPDLSMRVEDTINDPWSESQEIRAARCDKKDVSFCPPVAAANIQRMLGDDPDCLVSIAEDASTLSDVANRH